MENPVPIYDYASFLANQVGLGTLREHEANALMEVYQIERVLDFSPLGKKKAKKLQEALLQNWSFILKLH